MLDGSEAGRQAVRGFIVTLKDKNEDVRREAAEALGEIADARIVEPLIGTLKDEDERRLGEWGWLGCPETCKRGFREDQGEEKLNVISDKQRITADIRIRLRLRPNSSLRSGLQIYWERYMQKARQRKILWHPWLATYL